MVKDSASQIELLKSEKPVSYDKALEFMKKRVAGIIAGTHPQTIWFLEHEHVYTAGTSSNDNELLSPNIIPVHKTGRGGKYTYHGPGQLIMYPLWDLTFWKKDLRWFVHQMEQVVIDATRELLLTPEPDGVIVGRDATHTGVWVTTTTTTTNGHRRPNITTKKRKIAAIGISASRWITSHGICYNIHPNLQHYDAIVPCGIPSHHPTAVDTEHDDESSSGSPVKSTKRSNVKVEQANPSTGEIVHVWPNAEIAAATLQLPLAQLKSVLRGEYDEEIGEEVGGFKWGFALAGAKITAGQASPTRGGGGRKAKEAWLQFRDKLYDPSEPHIYKGGNRLRDYQVDGVNWLASTWYKRQGCVLADGTWSFYCFSISNLKGS